MARPTRGETIPATSEAERQAADDPGQRPAGFGGDRRGEDGGEIVGGAPGEDLREAEAGDDNRRRRVVRCPQAATPQQAAFAGFGAAPACSRSRPRRPPSRRRPLRQQASALRWRRPAAAGSLRRRDLELRGSRRADAGLRQHELRHRRRRRVAGDRRRDRARLLVAGEQQEGRRAPVALHADRVEARLGMRELAVAVRRDGAAGMHVRDRSAARAPGRFPATDRARAAARASATRSGRCPVATTMRSTGPICRAPSAVSPSSDDAARRSLRTAVVRKPVTSVTRPLSTSAFTSAPSSPRAGSSSASAAAIDADQVGAAHHPDDRRCRFRLAPAWRDRAARWRPNSPRRRPAIGLARIGVAVPAEHVGDAVGEPVAMLGSRLRPEAAPRRAGSDWSRCPRRR